MDSVAVKINQFLGVYPDNLERRVTIAMSAAVVGAIFVLASLLYIFTNFSTTLFTQSGGLREATYASNNLGYFLMVVYALLIGSLLYYVFLPWKSRIRKY